MSKVERVTAEGTTLAEATKAAASQLGVPIEEVAVEYDREHLAGGAATIRIFAYHRPPVSRAPGEGEDRRAARDPRRDETIKKRAREAVERVKGGAAEALVEDLNSYERHLVHNVVRDAGGFKSCSVGDGLRKTVVVTRAD